ncbi:MAG: hypothetical protein ABI083_09930 [Lapillicoccus sp.]
MSSRTLGAACAVSLLAVAVGAIAQMGPASASSSSTTAPARTTASVKLNRVYEGKVVNQSTILGPQSNPTVLTSTPPLPAGTYLVTSIVGAVISSHDQIVCATSVSGNDGVFGTAGNPGTGSIYGTATATDTVSVTTAGARISVVCNSFNYGLGTSAGEAVVEAIPVATVFR